MFLQKLLQKILFDKIILLFFEIEFFRFLKM